MDKQPKNQTSFSATTHNGRLQAKVNGLLVDVSALASKYDFKIPVALSYRAWKEAVSWPKRNFYCTSQFRTIALLQAARNKIVSVKNNSDHEVIPQKKLFFDLMCYERRISRKGRLQLVTLKMVFQLGRDELGGLVGTIYLDDEMPSSHPSL